MVGDAVKTRERAQTGSRSRNATWRKRPPPGHVNLKCVRERRTGRVSKRTTDVALSFGIPLFSGPVLIVEPKVIPLVPGKIVLCVGPSGSGKTSVLGRIEQQRPGGCMVHRVSFPAEAAIIDRVAPWATVYEAISILTTCGLGEPHLWVQRFSELSDGEKFRARLARAVTLHTRGVSSRPLLCDEFCSNLHRRAAKAISFNLHKLVERQELVAVLACSNEDLIQDLQPHVVVRLNGHGRCDVRERRVQRRGRPSFLKSLKIEAGNKHDYDEFAAMHYRKTDELGFVDKVFVIRDKAAGDALGIVVYAHGPLELRLRNEATGGRFSRNASRLNRELRILRRLVVHPDVRGCGVGHYLVERTLPLVGTRYVECLAAMGEFNPVFEKAGMKRIGQYKLDTKRQAALDALRAMDVNPNSREFPLQVSRRRRVRDIVSAVVRDWYCGATAGGEVRVDRQSPETLAQTFRGLIGSRPVYYLWQKEKDAA